MPTVTARSNVEAQGRNGESVNGVFGIEMRLANAVTYWDCILGSGVGKIVGMFGVFLPLPGKTSLRFGIS